MPSTTTNTITPSPRTSAFLTNHKTGSVRTIHIISNPPTTTSETYTPFSFLPNHGLVHPANRRSYTSYSSSSKFSVYSTEEKKSQSSGKSMASSVVSTDSFGRGRGMKTIGEVQGRRVYLSLRKEVAAKFRI